MLREIFFSVNVVHKPNGKPQLNIGLNVEHSSPLRRQIKVRLYVHLKTKTNIVTVKCTMFVLPHFNN